MDTLEASNDHKTETNVFQIYHACGVSRVLDSEGLNYNYSEPLPNFVHFIH